jgi:hypothetical protein
MLIISLHNNTHGNELADPLLLSKQLIDIWIDEQNILKYHYITRGYKLDNKYI